MPAKVTKVAELGPLQITLATGKKGDLVPLCKAPPEVLVRLQTIDVLPNVSTEMTVNGVRYMVLETIRGSTLAVRAGDLDESGIRKALQAAIEALFTLDSVGSGLPEGTVTLRTLVQRADGRWAFDLVGAAIQAMDLGQASHAQPGIHIRALLRVLRSLPHLRGAARLRRVESYLAKEANPQSAILISLCTDLKTSTPMTWCDISKWLTGTSSFTLIAGLILAASYLAGSYLNSMLLPSDSHSEWMRAEKPLQSPEPFRQARAIEIVIHRGGSVARLHGWSGEPSSWVRFDDLYTFLGADTHVLGNGEQWITWQFGQVRMTTAVDVVLTDGNGRRYVPLTRSMQAALRLHPSGTEDGALHFVQEEPS